ncbi:DNA-binding protein [Limnohabitans sp.]|uniref:DNA-binding protein n=1 Tax=Limnohabitans sp. TaxID=1907725 RepID=UPI00286FAEE3|nr:DNA-binding protein [Limnohabitans sp.]
MKRQARQPIHRSQDTVATPLEWPQVDDELLRTLPPVLRAVVRALGFGRARDFLERQGGAPIWVPAHKKAAWGLTPGEMDRLRHVLQPHLNETRRITLPKVDKLFLKYRNEQIVRERGARSVRAIAQAHALTMRQVTNIFRQAEGEAVRPKDAAWADFVSRQTDLFA